MDLFTLKHKNYLYKEDFAAFAEILEDMTLRFKPQR
jgi:hypothetical protein